MRRILYANLGRPHPSPSLRVRHAVDSNREVERSSPAAAFLPASMWPSLEKSTGGSPYLAESPDDSKMTDTYYICARPRGHPCAQQPIGGMIRAFVTHSPTTTIRLGRMQMASRCSRDLTPLSCVGDRAQTPRASCVFKIARGQQGLGSLDRRTVRRRLRTRARARREDLHAALRRWRCVLRR